MTRADKRGRSFLLVIRCFIREVITLEHEEYALEVFQVISGAFNNIPYEAAAENVEAAQVESLLFVMDKMSAELHEDQHEVERGQTAQSSA